MVTELMAAISMRLNEVFGDGFDIYVNDVAQGLTEPCFFIALLQPERTPLPGGRARQDNPFDIHYIPPDSADNAGMIAVAERLMDAMETVTTPEGVPVRGTGRRYEIVDGVIHFFVNYNVHLRTPPEQEDMETLRLSAGTTKG